MEDPDVTEMKKNCNNREYVLQAVKGKGKLFTYCISCSCNGLWINFNELLKQ